MSRLEELIEKLCPDGVEYIELKNVCRFQNGFSFKSSLFKDKGEPILRITNIADGKLTDKNYAYFNKADYKENLEKYEVKSGDVVIAMSGATTGKIGYNYSLNTYYLNQRVGLFVPDRNKLLKRYLYYWLSTQRANILNISSGTGAQPNLSTIKMMNFKLPVPLLEIQQEIVNILDKFSSITRELSMKLSKELKARKKQYEYYNEKIWGTIKDSKRIELLKLCNIGDGLHGTPKYMKGTGFWFINGNNLENGKIAINNSTKEVSEESYNKYNKKLKKGTILMSINGTIGKMAYYNREKIILGKSSAFFEIVDEDLISNKYLYYYLQSQEALKYYENSKTGSTIKNLGLKALKKMKVPIPSKKEQERIVNILDKFEKLYNNISENLPSEIEARQKQYEYYRDRLLNFKELQI